MKFVTTAGKGCSVQTPPPSVVARMLGAAAPKSLTAWQLAALEQETDVNTPTPAGTLCEVQEDPPSVVLTMTGLPKMPKPTAVQSEGAGQEIPFSPLTPVGIESGVHP